MLISSPAFSFSDLNERNVRVGRKGREKLAVAILKDEILKKKKSPFYFIFLGTLIGSEK